ncbi:hypothetical protein J2X69_002130 [Algoriphagus sp. 4150]|uniref:hypothetical protein n=1 Tax=Algoriphagus sp. 4150 TaxID=2817756 RepID=UPI00285DB92B|nr:hypothetical protein [Algoriphagus sp. 4150]MDR7129784.1 hypothetical protein [Algoriphagus sp. 4150]
MNKLKKLRKALVLVFASIFPLTLLAQSEKPSSSTFSIESRISNFAQRGYDLKVFYYPASSRMSYGISLTGQGLGYLGKRLVFSGENLEDINIRVTWVASLLARYYFASDYRGFFAEFSGGVEEFKATYQNITVRDVNGFLSLSAGYLWFPFKRDNFYVMPKASINFLVFRPEIRHIGPAAYRLRVAHPNPSLTIGWKF